MQDKCLLIALRELADPAMVMLYHRHAAALALRPPRHI
jgi:hypothetical protein